MAKTALIKNFVRNNLGCSCPEQVFTHIEQDQAEGDDRLHRLTIGGRLLIYLVTVDDATDLAGLIDLYLCRGVSERDQRALHRFRLVLVVDEPDSMRDKAQQFFTLAGSFDEKTHLHLVMPEDIEALGLAVRLPESTPVVRC